MKQISKLAAIILFFLAAALMGPLVYKNETNGWQGGRKESVHDSTPVRCLRVLKGMHPEHSVLHQLVFRLRGCR